MVWKKGCRLLCSLITASKISETYLPSWFSFKGLSSKTNTSVSTRERFLEYKQNYVSNLQGDTLQILSCDGVQQTTLGNYPDGDLTAAFCEHRGQDHDSSFYDKFFLFSNFLTKAAISNQIYCLVIADVDPAGI